MSSENRIRKDPYVYNWSKNIRYSSDLVLVPENIDELKAIVADPQFACLKVIGTRHCFNFIADTYQNKPIGKRNAHISLEKFTRATVSKKGQFPTVTLQPGLTFSKLIEVVDKHGLAIENLPSLPHLNVVGSLMTATHGSGHKFKILADMVEAFDMLFANGQVKTFKKNESPYFKHYLLTLGGIGIVTSVTLRLEEGFNVSKSIFQDLSWEALLRHQDQIMLTHDYLSFFTQFKERKMTSVWVGRRYAKGHHPHPVIPDFFGAKPISTPRIHPVPGRDSSPCVTVGNGSWREKIYHFLPDQPPSSAGEEMHSEYFVKYSDFLPALEALHKINDKFTHLLQISELRMCAADDIPLSPAREGQPVVGIHFTWFKKPKEVILALPHIERALAPFLPIPHYGKIFRLSGQYLEERFGEMNRVRRHSDIDMLRAFIVHHDPKGKFRNCFLDKYLFKNKKGTISNLEVQKQFIDCHYCAKL